MAKLKRPSTPTMQIDKEHRNLASKTQTIANQRFTTTYSYDENDRMTQQTYPSGRVINPTPLPFNLHFFLILTFRGNAY